MKFRSCDMSAAAAIVLTATVAHAEPPKAAVFNFQLANLGAQGPTNADLVRLGPVTDLLRAQLKDTGCYEIVLTAPVKADVVKADLRN